LSSEEAELARVEAFIGKILAIGTYGSACVLVFGFVLSLLFPNQPDIQVKQLLSFSFYLNQLLGLQAQAIIYTGLFLLILTPVLRVIVSIWSFAKEKDWLYVGITVVVLIVLLSSFVYGMYE